MRANGLPPVSVCPFKLPGFVRDAAKIVEPVKVRLQIRMRHDIVLNGHIRRQEVISVALLEMKSEYRFNFEKPERLIFLMNTRTSTPFGARKPSQERIDSTG